MIVSPNCNMDHYYQQHQYQQQHHHHQDPLGIVVYNDLPDGACFNRTLARESARSCPSSSSTSMKTLQNPNSALRMASRPLISRPTTLRPLQPKNHDHYMIYETVDKPAQYLGSFPVRAIDQSTRANLVRKQLSSMKEVPTKRPVLINISLDGIKVCCPKGQNIYSNHSLRRISYATCDPATNLLAFLARETHAPLHLQHCHVFRTTSPDQAEDLNMLIGNAFRVAYASQLQDEQSRTSRPGSAMEVQGSSSTFGRHHMPTSRSADSLLSPDFINDDLGIADVEDEPVYETPDFSRSSYLRHSENTFQRSHQLSHHQRSTFSSQRLSTLKARPPLTLPTPNGQTTTEDLFSSIQVAQDPRPQMPNSSKSKFKPNSLPVLNCLFAALGRKNGNQDRGLDDTPYVAVPDLFSRFNNNVLHSQKGHAAAHHARTGSKMGSSFTQEDLRMDGPRSSYYDSGQYANQCRYQQGTRTLNANAINKSKSAHVISCEVYSEVADHANQPHFTFAALNTKSRRPANWSVDSIRQTLDASELIVSPGCNSSRNGSSGFSSGEASTNSSATTPPPLAASRVMSSSECSKSILDEPELRSAPWFQDEMPRDLSLDVLKSEPEGSFIVRASNSKNGLALSVRVPNDFHPEGIVHYLIIRAPKGFKVKGCQKQFPSIHSLLVHHSVMPEMLPCPLLMNRYTNPAYKATEDSETSFNEDDNELDDEDNYLDPERDYELINSLRQCILNNKVETD